MESIGPYLKQVRESKGFTLEHVASLTRIQTKTLEALEAEQFAQLPQPVFIRGFLRTYARTLGIDEEDVLRRFAEASSQFYAQREAEAQRLRLHHEAERRDKRTRNLFLGLTASVLIGLVLLLPRQHEPEPSSTASTPSSVPEPSHNAAQTDEALPPVKADSPSVQSPSSGNTMPSSDAPTPATAESAQLAQQPVRHSQTTSTTDSPNAVLPQRLELEAKELTWIVVQADDEKPQEALLKPGERAAWTAQKRFTLTLGNAGGVTVTLNGQTLEPFGKPGVVVRDIVLPSE